MTTKKADGNSPIFTPMLTEKIKACTLSTHQALEKQLVQKIRVLKDMDDYRALLQVFYRYFGGLEALIAPFITTAELPDYQQRRKAEHIAADLRQLGATLPAIAGAAELPLINTTAGALGALYVMEGSTLGGQIIVKMLRKQLGAEMFFPASFFNGYGPQTAQRWAGFQTALNDYSSAERDELLIAAANQTFQKFSEQFQAEQQAR
jgi:heme oxygenase